METIKSRVKSFYENYPFPDYDLNRYVDRDDLRKNASALFKLFDYYIPYDARIADIGCGTGQLANFLSLQEKRTITGIDISARAINKACQLKQKMGIGNLALINRDLFETTFEREFDFIFCLGVLNHIQDSFAGFRVLTRALKDRGYLIIGLYNTFGRLLHTIRKKVLYNLSANALIKNYLIKALPFENDDAHKAESWYLDQYKHPYEKSFRISEVLGWFESEGIQYVNSFPPIEPFEEKCLKRDVVLSPTPFKKRKQGRHNLLFLFFKELGWIFSLDPEAGYSIFIGEKLSV